MTSDPEPSPDTASRTEREIANSQGGSLPMLALAGGIAVGCIGLMAGMVLLFRSEAAHELSAVGGGLCLIASALAFGLMANALWRK